MNTYSENFQQAASSTLSALINQKTTVDSSLGAANTALYYAQGAQITAVQKLSAAQLAVAHSDKVNAESLAVDNQAINILATATESQANVATTTTNVATAAANIQIASNAIATLAADVGAALNLASASLFGTDTFKKIQDLNDYLNETANNAKAASLTAMEATGFAAEIIAGDLLAQATRVKTKFDNILSITQADFVAKSDAVVADNAVLTQAKNQVRQSEGLAIDARKDDQAVQHAYAKANKQLNLNLAVQMANADNGVQVTVSLDQLQSPLPKFYDAKNSGKTIPDAEPNYFLTFVSLNQAPMFTYAQAEQLFAARDSSGKAFIACSSQPATAAQNKNVAPALSEQPNTTAMGVALESSNPSDGAIAEVVIVLEETNLPSNQGAESVETAAQSSAPFQDPVLLGQMSAAGSQPTHNTAVSAPPIFNTFMLDDSYVDAYGEKIKPNNAYVAFVYIELSNEYKRFVANFSDILTVASKPFYFAADLPMVTSVEKVAAINLAKPGYTVAPAELVKVFQSQKIEVDYRLILLEAKQPSVNNQAAAAAQSASASESKKPAERAESTAAVYFDTAIAQRVSAANYLTGKPTGEGKKDIVFIANDSATDCYGNPLVEGISYIPCVLAVLKDASAAFTNQYNPTLTFLSAITVSHK